MNTNFTFQLQARVELGDSGKRQKGQSKLSKMFPRSSTKMQDFSNLQHLQEKGIH